MKKLLKVTLLAGLVILAAYAIRIYFYKWHPSIGIDLINKDLKISQKYKGLKGAVDFTTDGFGNYYIAYNTGIQFIDSSGKSHNLIENKDFDISSIDYNGGKVYYSSKDSIYCYDMLKNKNEKFFSGIPNYGDYNRSIVRVRGNLIYVSIGAATNSGVIGNDNKWKETEPYFHDMTPYDVTLKGENFGDKNTGVFQSYKTKSISGQIVSSHFPGNASIITINLNNRKANTFAWGIRNVKGMDFNDENKPVCSVGGMEERGARAVYGDNDYIYEVNGGYWYGWPDYSGGDPITSPKFKSRKNLSFVFENHPNMNPPSPVYQGQNVSSLGSLAVDSSGNIGEKNCIFFYNRIYNAVYSFEKSRVEKTELKLKKGSNISSMKIYNKNLMMLDSGSGYMYSISRRDAGIKDINYERFNSIYVYLIICGIASIVLVLRIKRD